MSFSESEAELIEVFSAIQGEGPIVGRRQLFVRFGRCDVTCLYCDTPLCHVDLPRARIETSAGSRQFETHANPVPVPTILGFIARLAAVPGRHHSVSFTGGEPLLHWASLRRLAQALPELGLLAYLETNGHLVEELRRVIDVIDIVGMDVKIPSTTGFAERFAENRRFLQVACEAGKEVFVKIVVGRSTPDDELRAALRVVADVAPETEVVLQPVTPFRGQGEAPEPARLLQMQDLALSILGQVRVIPQTHKMIGQL